MAIFLVVVMVLHLLVFVVLTMVVKAWVIVLKVLKARVVEAQVGVVEEAWMMAQGVAWMKGADIVEAGLDDVEVWA